MIHFGSALQKYWTSQVMHGCWDRTDCCLGGGRGGGLLALGTHSGNGCSLQSQGRNVVLLSVEMMKQILHI